MARGRLRTDAVRRCAEGDRLLLPERLPRPVGHRLGAEYLCEVNARHTKQDVTRVLVVVPELDEQWLCAEDRKEVAQIAARIRA